MTIIIDEYYAKIGQVAEITLIIAMGKNKRKRDTLVPFGREEKVIIANSFYKLQPIRPYL